MARAETKATSYRLSTECHELLLRISDENQVSQASVIELGVRLLARRLGMLPSSLGQTLGIPSRAARTKKPRPGGSE